MESACDKRLLRANIWGIFSMLVWPIILAVESKCESVGNFVGRRPCQVTDELLHLLGLILWNYRSSSPFLLSFFSSRFPLLLSQAQKRFLFSQGCSDDCQDGDVYGLWIERGSRLIAERAYIQQVILFPWVSPYFLSTMLLYFRVARRLLQYRQTAIHK